MIDLIIIGAGGFGREVSAIIKSINTSSINKKFNFLGYVDDGIASGELINENKVLGGLEYLNTVSNNVQLVVAIGNPSIKEKIYNTYKNFEYPNIIHPSVEINGFDVKLGIGCIICKGTIITCNIILEDFIILNLACTIGHDTIVRDFSSCMPAVNISGEVVINKSVYIGTGVTIINKIEVGERTVIGAGAVVSKNLPSNCTAVGIPAKPIKFH